MSNPTGNIITVDSVAKSFDNGNVPVLQDVSLTVKEGEVAALWGSSGSGKTTLLHILGGLDTQDRGTVTVAGLNPASESDRLTLRRKKVGFIFQLHNLIADLTTRENCLITAVGTRGNPKEFADRFDQLAETLGIAHRQNRRIQELSGGERQRAAVCRALMHKPSLILADEPTGSLDEKNGEQVFELLKQLAKREGVTIVMATHERRFVDTCDRIFSVRNGTVSEV
jgi:lipoprotein-releasing system ATP-binding protein